MTPPRAFVEAPAGLASVSLRLHGGPHCRPPISRMGNKAGYAEAILGLAGLRSGQSAGAFVWAEADADVRGLLRAYPDAAMLRRVADIIRGWADEEPRALWGRLRAERKARGPVANDVGVAGWLFVAGGSMMGAGEAPFGGNLEGWSGGEHGHGTSKRPLLERLPDCCTTLAEYAQIAASNRLINIGGPTLENTGKGGTTFGGEAFATPAGETADGFERLAGFMAMGELAFRAGDPDSGFAPGATEWGGLRSGVRGEMGHRRPPARSLDGVANLAVPISHSGGWPPVAVLPSIPTAAELSAMLGTPGDLDGVIVYKDPDYQGTTGYTATYPRADVVRNALEAAAMGALVMVSEAVAVEELVAHGWHAVDIGHTRRGQKRTFARVATEYVTMNRAPVHVHARQVGLFLATAGAA